MKEITIKERKEISLNILDYIDGLCKKNNLKYFLFAGTALGAVRHGGFIPWDDDLDIIMPISDYKKLLKLLRHQNKYSLIEPYEGEFNLFFSKLCDKRTSAKQDNDRYIRGFGVWVDIFPLNNAGDTLEEARKFVKKCAHNYKMFDAFGVLEKYYYSENKIKQLAKLILYFPLKIYYSIDFQKKKRKALSFMESKNNKKTKYVCSNAMDGASDIFPRELFEESTKITFEGKEYPICKQYERFLTIKYGDYMTPPPESEQTYKHSGTFVWIEDEK